jgi:jumonji domain-containing protein 7
VLTTTLAENDNLREEYAALYADVEANISWARIALQADPDAINLWIGNSCSVTALHRDNYENVYCQIIGSKRFVLLPPIAMPCVNEKMLRPATYAVRCIWPFSDAADRYSA